MDNAIRQAGEIDIQPPDWVTFDVKDRLLLIAPADKLRELISQLEGFDITALQTDSTDSEKVDSSSWLTSTPDELTGWLSEFSLLIDGETRQFDLVLDLSEKPLIERQVLPLGYFSPRNDSELESVLNDLPEMQGVFDKPRFFNYRADICAHSRRGIEACSNCIDACPAEAITGIGDGISVNPNLCQGCGSCAAVCPSGAMTYALPTLDQSLNRLRQMIAAFRSHHSDPLHLLIHDTQSGEALVEAVSDWPVEPLCFDIEEIGGLSMPFWLSAVAYGADSVTVLDALTHDDHDWQELKTEINNTNELLTGMGYQPVVHWLQTNQTDQLASHIAGLATGAEITPANYVGMDEKRRMTTMALTHLHEQAPEQSEEVKLDSTAAFGEIVVDKDACTLCMSCVSVCPMGALVDGVDKPQLNFIEDLCVQCGMCETACPENAIDLAPRYLYDRDEARRTKLLYEEAIFHCIRCSKPFATQKMIDTITGKLKDHHMFQGDALDRLKMCEDCRVKSMFSGKGHNAGI